MTHTVYIGVGGNLGDRIATIRKAIAAVSDLPGTRLTRQSSLYESEPEGKARNWFVNGVIEILTDLEPNDLLKALLKIETSLGRKREKGKKSVSRTIDLDILLYDSEVVEKRNLKIPHPRIEERKFVLLPLSELAPAYKHPVSGSTITTLLVACPDKKKAQLFKH